MKKMKLNIQMFAEFNANVADLVKKFTVDGEFDAEGANKQINADILKFNSKNQPKVEEFKEKAREEVIKELGITDVTNENQLKAHIASLSSNEDAQKIIDLTKQLEEITTDSNKYKADYETANGELLSYKNEKHLIGKGISAKDADYHMFKISKMVTDDLDFAAATEKYATDNPQHFVATPTPPKVVTTGKPHVNKTGEAISGVRQALIDSGKIKVD